MHLPKVGGAGMLSTRQGELVWVLLLYEPEPCMVRPSIGLGDELQFHALDVVVRAVDAEGGVAQFGRVEEQRTATLSQFM